MSIPLSIFLYLYLAFLAAWLVFSLIGIYHMLKFGFKTPATLIATFSYIIVSLLILFASFVYVSQIDWQRDISVLSWLDDGVSSEQQVITR